jgi:hypothetical protein
MNPPTLLAHVALVPGKLSARIVLAEIHSGAGPLPCWVYVTEGLRAFGQRELGFALRRLPHEAPNAAPPDPLQFFGAVCNLAEQGRLVDANGFSELGSNGFMGDRNWRGFGYLPNHPLLALPAPPDALAVIGLVGLEMDVAKRFGATRVAARLGQAARQYPFPTWAERGRACLVSPDSLEQTILNGVSVLSIPGATAVLADNRITLRLPPARAVMLRELLAQAPPNAAFGILCELDPSADALLVWQPGQRGPEAISPEGSRGARVGGCFVLFVGQQQADEGRVFEDGFALMVRDASNAAIRRALTSGTPLDLPATAPGMSFAIAWDRAN